MAHEMRNTALRVCCVCPPTVDTPLLDQITSDARTLRQQQPIGPELIIDALERSIEAGDLLCLPGRGTKTLWRLRRFAPWFLWRAAHRVQGD